MARTVLNKLKDFASRLYQLFQLPDKVVYIMNGSKIIVSFPMNSLLDLGTFEMNFYEKLLMLALVQEIKKNMFKQDFFQGIFNH